MISRPETPVPSENSLGREGVQLSTSPAQSQPQTSASPVRRTGFMALTRNLFASSNREKDQVRQMASLVTNEGSISQVAWAGMGKNSASKTRIRTLVQLQDVLKSRNLQVSTLEGIWHESKDMLSDPDTKEPALRAIIEMTETQHKQLGLALRHTFFEKISEIGCEELTLKWLNALSEFGRNVNGFEKDMDVLIADWIKHTLFEKDHPQSLLVLQLAQMFIQHNSAFIGDGKMTIIVHSVCIRACKTMEPLTKNCLDVLDSVLKYSDLPRGELMSVVTTICVLVCDPKFRQQAWALAKALLTSQIGHRTRKSLISILNGNGRRKGTSVNDEPNEKKMKRMLKGAVFCLANANWGTSQIDTVRCSPANVIEPMENAVKVDENICGDVLLALRRLIQKHGRDLQQITWIKLIHLFEVVIDLCENKPAYSSVCEESLHQLLLLTEQLYSDGHFAASADMLYDLIEKCADRRPDNSVIALIEYRAGNITPLTPNWISRMFDLIKVYSCDSQAPERRSKAISELHAFYTRYRMLYEHELITQLMIPILQETENEKDSRIQYLMLNVLFDVAKTVSLRGDSLLFESVIALIRQLFNGSVLRSSSSDSVVDNEGLEIIRDENRIPTPESTVLSFDNLEIIAQGVGELLAERWLQLNLHTTNLLIGILVEHIRYQYDVGWTGEQGADVRVRVFSALLSIHCCPITNRLIRHGLGEDCPRVNMYITRRIDANNASGFSWADICSVITDAATTDSWWPVLRAILQQLGRVLEHIQLVRTATDAHVDRLTQALVALYQRAERKEIALHITSDDKQLKGQIAKFLPPVLSTLLNYTFRQETKNKELCRVLVECVAHESMEAVMACDIAIQLAPSSMAGLALILTETLARLQSTAVRAIPIMELLSDSAEIPEFHKFFQVKHFRSIVDTLAPYTNVHKFNTFIVAAIHRVMMRWFARVPEKMRHEIKCHMENSVRMSPLLPLQELSGVNRQPSGDGRQVPGALFLLGGSGIPETPPPMDGVGAKEERGPDRIHDEVLRAMSAFFQLGRIEDDKGFTDIPDRLVESSQDHYFINDTILSVCTLVEKVKDKGKDKDEDIDNVFIAAGESVDKTSSVQASSPPNGFHEQRRRHQSAVQPRRILRKASAADGSRPKALDDLYATAGPHQQRRISVSKIPIVSYTQLTVRHIYGKSRWMLRSLDEWPEDFERTTSIPAEASTLLHHIANQPGAIWLGKKSNDVNLQRGLRSLDRISGIELHVVGVLYVGPQQESEADILSNTYGSDRYARFIKLLGSPISLNNCPGGLLVGEHGSYTYEYIDELSRIIFLVATLMPNKDPQFNTKKKLIGNNFVSIVFNESGAPFKLGSVCGQFAHVAIEVIPYDTGSVLVQVHAKPEISCWLAMRRALLSDESAARLLRKMIVRTQLSVNVWRRVQEDPEQPYISQGVDRLRKIQAIKDKCGW